MANILNLTPHTINIVSADGAHVADIEPAGVIARVATATESAGVIAGIPVVRTTFGKVEGLPEPEEGTYYITSSLLAAAAKATGRDTSDLLVPGRLLRDEAGRPIGCVGLSLV